MAIADPVILEYGIVESPGPNEPPLRGIVTAQALPAVTVLWENAELSDGLDSQLREVFAPPEAARALYGKWVQVTSYPGSEIGAPKSPAASGLVVDVVAHGPFESADADRVDLVVATEDGKQMISVLDVYDFAEGEIRPTAGFQVVEGRRKV